MTELLTEVAAWFAAAGRWTYAEPGSVPFRLVQHLSVSVVATATAVAVALPAALALAHRRTAEAFASAVVNLGRAIPSFGLIVLFWLLAIMTGVSTEFWPLVAALVALAVPPIFTNAYTAVREVDAATVESARGMGLDERQVLRDVELPIAAPVILAGIRIAFIQVIATTAIGAIVTNGGGFGRYVVDGFAVGAAGHDEVLAGALLIALLTLVAEGLFGLGERLLLPRGVRRTVRTADVAQRAGAAA